MHADISAAGIGARFPLARLFGSGPASLADALREQTREAHTRAEGHPIQIRLVRGEATRGEYAAWLGQMLRVWKAVDANVAKLARRDNRVAAMLKPYHAHANRIAADLSFLGHEPPHGRVLPATSSFVIWLSVASANSDAAVVGAWYVLEGSANGGRFIARSLSRALDITGPKGLTALDPHGEAQRERWQAWRASLDAQRWSRTDRDSIVTAAKRTFDALYQIMEGLERHPDVVVTSDAQSPSVR